MRIIKYILFALSASLLLQSCEWEDSDLNALLEEEFLSFSSPSASILESSPETVQAIVEISKAQAQDVTVSYTVTPTGGAVEGVDYRVLSPNPVTIPAGSYSAIIEIEPIDNIVNEEEDRVLQIEITDISAGVPVVANQTFSLDLLNNDCFFDTEGFTGEYEVAEVFTSGTNAGTVLAAAFGESYRLEMTPIATDASGTSFVISDVTGNNQFFPADTEITFFPCPSTVQFSSGATVNVAAFADLTLEEASFDPDAKTITLSGPLGGFGPYEIVLTRAD